MSQDDFTRGLLIGLFCINGIAACTLLFVCCAAYLSVRAHCPRRGRIPQRLCAALHVVVFMIAIQLVLAGLSCWALVAPTATLLNFTFHVCVLTCVVGRVMAEGMDQVFLDLTTIYSRYD